MLTPWGKIEVKVIHISIKTDVAVYLQKHNNTRSNNVNINALTAVGALIALIDFTLCNARRFYLSMGNPLAGKGLTTLKTYVPINALTAHAVGALMTLIDFLTFWRQTILLVNGEPNGSERVKNFYQVWQKVLENGWKHSCPKDLYPV